MSLRAAALVLGRRGNLLLSMTCLIIQEIASGEKHRPRNDMGKELFFQQLQKVFAELGHLRRNHSLTIRLELIVREIFLVIIFGDVELVNGGYFCNDGTAPDLLGIQIADEILGNFLLLRRVIKNGRAVLRANIPALTVQRGGVMDGEEDIQNITE